MDHPRKAIILGREHESRGELYSVTLDSLPVALGTSVGVTSKANEDAVGVAVSNSEMILAIADGHWGRGASELANSKSVELLPPDVRPSTDIEIREQLFDLYEQVNTELYEMATSAAGMSTPETTLIICHVNETISGKYLYWSSFGDSYLFLLQNGILKQLNSLNPFWLGYLSKMSENANTRSLLMRFLANEVRYVCVAGGLETGVEKLEAGAMVFLCTDGLVGSDEKPEQSILHQLSTTLLSETSLLTKVENMIAFALKRGEVDNVSCVLAQIS